VGPGNDVDEKYTPESIMIVSTIQYVPACGNVRIKSFLVGHRSEKAKKAAIDACNLPSTRG
jgi:hypothetical protein